MLDLSLCVAQVSTKVLLNPRLPDQALKLVCLDLYPHEDTPSPNTLLSAKQRGVLVTLVMNDKDCALLTTCTLQHVHFYGALRQISTAVREVITVNALCL